MSDDDKAGFAGGQIGVVGSLTEAAAAGQMTVGMEAFREAARSLGNVAFEQSKGNLFEYIEAARFNEQAALHGEGARAVVTAAVGRPTDPVDLEIVDGKALVERIQAKVSDRPAWVAHALRQDKYRGMQRLVPRDAEVRVRELTNKRAAAGNVYADEYRDSAKHLTGEAHHGDVASGGTTRAELRDAHAHPDRFALGNELPALGRQMAKAGLVGAAGGAVVGGAIAIVKSSYRFHKGEVEGEQAVLEVVGAAGKGALRGGASGAGGAVVSHVAMRVGANALAKTNVATTIASSTIQAGVSVWAFARGEIEAEDLAARLGQNGVSTMSSLYVGATAGAVFGPAGALVGSAVGYMVASDAFGATMAILREARLAQAEADRLESLAEECLVAMEAERHRVAELLDELGAGRVETWGNTLDLYDAAMLAGSDVGGVEAMAALAALVGVELKFASFEAFDAFMLDEGSGPLVL